jgi:two-component system sensor histidine kinase AlgZ
VGRPARRVLGGGAVAGRPEFFVPELCNPLALTQLVLMGELVAVAVVLAAGVPGWERFALVSFFVQWVVLASAGLLCVVRPYLARVPMRAGAALSFALVLAVTAVMTVVGRRIMGVEDVFDASVLLRHVGIGGIVGGLLLRYFFVQQQLRRQEESELKSRIQALQSRIRPHFLFNSMNIIASLIPTDPETAETVVEDLSELFRASLNEAGNQVSFDEELALCERYVRIEGLRLDDRLHVTWDIGELPEGISIPLLTLQPLLENAIYHGIQPLPEGGTIHVSARHEAGLVHVRITNPVPPPDHYDDRHTQGNRMAMANIRSRLSFLYGERASLEGVRDGTEWVTTLIYPARGTREEPR